MNSNIANTVICLLFCRVEAVRDSDAAGSDPGCDAEWRQREVLDNGGQAWVGQGRGRPAHAGRVQRPVDMHHDKSIFPLTVNKHQPYLSLSRD